MVRPLYNGSDQLLHGVPRPCNAGLWYDKFCDRWDSNFENLVGTSPEEQGKQKWIQTITESSHKDEDLREFSLRHYELIQNCSGIVQHFKLTSDFVTGLGREHPVENGFAWHHTLGSPYLPGSSVKGMVRAWASQWNDDVTINKDEIDRIFGFQDNVGTVIFMDALPISNVQLKADIMTPHYSPYYQAEPKDVAKYPPADWYSPTPIPFLVVAKGATFQFGIVPKNPECEQCKIDCQAAKKWLTDALEWIGAGAKTAVGYGRFEPDTDSDNKLKDELKKKHKEEEHERQTQQALQGKSSIAQELIRKAKEFDWELNKSKFVQDASIWLSILQQNPPKDALEFIKNLIDFHIPGILENPDATEGKKKKQKYKDSQIKLAKQFNEIRKNCK